MRKIIAGLLVIALAISFIAVAFLSSFVANTQNSELNDKLA